MSFPFGERLRAAFAPPQYLARSFAGIDLSASGVKAARLAAGVHGLTLAGWAEIFLAAGAFADGEIVDQGAVVAALAGTAHSAGITTANASLPESKSFLFETEVPGAAADELRVAVEQHLDELIPLPPAETVFDFVAIGEGKGGGTRVAGVGVAGRVIDDALKAFDDAKMSVAALEGEMFAMARALIRPDDMATSLIVDVGKTTTKLAIVAGRIPLFSATIAIGGHALTLAVQKYFGVTENEARGVKADRGIVPTAGNEEYLAAMLSTVSAIRDEIMRRLDYWQEKARASGHEPVERALLTGGNASVRGLPEYLEGALGVPVMMGDVFTNLASRDAWIPEIDSTEAPAYATAIGLALYDAYA